MDKIKRFKEIMKSLNEYMDELSKEGDYTLEYTKHKFSLYKQDYVGNYDVTSTLVDEYPAHRCFDAKESTHLKDHAEIGKCLLNCIHTYEYEGHFNLECFEEKFMLEYVCKLFGLDTKEELKNYGYEEEE